MRFGRVFFARNFDHKLIFETRKPEWNPFLPTKTDPNKTCFSSHLYRTVFDESGTDRKLTLSPTDLC